MLVIPGDMPDKCQNCSLEDHERLICMLSKKKTYDIETERYSKGNKSERPEWCPIIKEYKPEKISGKQ